MSIALAGNTAHRLHGRGVVVAALLVAFFPLASAAEATAKPTRPPQTEIEKKVFDLIRTNQLQATVSALIDVPEGERPAIAELADEHGNAGCWTKERSRI